MTTTMNINEVFQLCKSMDSIRKMSDEEIRDAIRVLDSHLQLHSNDELFSPIYAVYLSYITVEQERYISENEEEFNKFYVNNINGKRYDEIEPEMLDWYSDWHKDMFGYRPRPCGGIY